MSNNEQSIVTTRSGVFDPYPPQELLEVTLNLFGRTTEAQNVIYNLHPYGSFTPSGAFNMDDRLTRSFYSSMKADFLETTDTTATYSYLPEATRLLQRLGELGVSTFVDISHEDAEGTTTEASQKNDVPNSHEGTNATTSQNNDVRAAFETTNSQARDLLEVVDQLDCNVRSWATLGARGVPDDVTESTRESLECLQEVVASVKDLVDIDDRLRATSAN
ncbi:hypothetical protein JCM24511_06047 [Saitozyma sp. JCM 24511]|nr:hypothetical protein JCM24511_06047 [Saitozyma sp. JCM 24511]